MELDSIAEEGRIAQSEGFEMTKNIVNQLIWFRYVFFCGWKAGKNVVISKAYICGTSFAAIIILSIQIYCYGYIQLNNLDTEGVDYDFENIGVTFAILIMGVICA